MRYDSPTATAPSGRRPTLAREKNTSRAEARRRTREEIRAELAAEEALAEGPDYIDSTSPAEPARKPLFKMPNIREDLRVLPGMVRSKPILFLPLALFLVGLPLFIFGALNQLAPEVAGIASYYVQFFWSPPALFTFFIAGFFAPRASYLIGFIYGLIAAVIWSIGLLAVEPQLVDPATPLPGPSEVIPQMLLLGILYGTLAAALASWYREFLRGIQERGKARRGGKEVDERTRRRELRQEARKVAKRPTS